MIVSHIASMRSSRLAAQHQRDLAQKADENSGNSAISQARAETNLMSGSSELSQMSVLTLNETPTGPSLTTSSHIDNPDQVSSKDQSRESTRVIADKSKLGPLARVSDLDSEFDHDLKQQQLLETIETNWIEIQRNFNSVLGHLQSCNAEIVEASGNCLQTLTDSVEVACDQIDNETRALYHLMTKCDELTTKLSIAASFRDEIKTLRKSVETLEQLYKTRPNTTTPKPVSRLSDQTNSTSQTMNQPKG